MWASAGRILSFLDSAFNLRDSLMQAAYGMNGTTQFAAESTYIQ